MPHARRRTLRCSVLAASLAVIASLAVAPAAQADTAAPTGVEAAPTTQDAPATGEVATTTGSPAPTTGSSAPADPAATPSDVPAADVPGTPAPGVPTDVPPPTLDPGAISAGDTVVGELVQAFPDPEHDHDGDHVDEPLSWIETPEGNAVRVPTEDLPPAAAGATLAVTVGDEVADEASEDQGLAPALEVQSARVVAAATPDPTTAAAGAEATNIVTVVLVRPAGTTADSTTVDQVVDQVNGGVAAFWDEQSGGTVRISAGWGARGWVSSSASCSDPYGLWATAVSVTGWTQGPGRHLMVYVPSGAAGCAYGLGTVGSTVGSGGRSYVRDVATSVMAHELGHNFGLGHSSQYQCASTVETGSCQLNEYADYYDLMGFSWSQVGSLSTAQAALIGLLPPSEMVAFTPASAPATITLAPVSAATGTRAVKLTDSAGAVYWIEYRQASGRDAWLATSANSRRLDAGIVVRRVTADGNSTSLLLDGTPSPSSGWNADQQSALPVGSYVDIGADFAVRAQGGGVVAIGNRATVVADIDAAYARSGGATGVLRAPTSGVICGMVGSGCGRNYQGGVIYWTPGTGARTVTDPVLSAWGPRRESGVLGYPVSDYACGMAAGGCGQAFQGGRVYSTWSTGTHALYGAIQDAWTAQGYENGVLGYPTTDVICGMRSSGCGQVFQGGRIYSTPSTGTHALTGDVHTAWVASGYEVGRLGYPVTGLICGMRDGGCGQVFQGGRIYASPSSGAHAVSGAVQDAWIAQGWETGPLGYPTTDQVCGLAGGGCRQAFAGGAIYSSPGGTRAVSGGILAVWTASGAETGPLGYPTSGLICGLRGSGCGQVFQGGRVYSTAATGTHAVSGAIQDAWIAQGWETGPLGYPTGDAVCTAAGCAQSFAGGGLYASAGGTRSVTGAILAAWTATGGHTGSFGFPTSGLVCGLRNGGCGQVFQGGRIYTTAATGTHAVSGRIQDAWIAQGWETGPLGYPTGDARPVAGGTAQDFQGGTLTLDTASGIVTRS
ncbi:reprolysin-like metallopeptidase [Klenkia terrae]|uniref:Zinc-dependent metalloprotease family protein n=1 Tax=Klenkia terrae TaxID=1052259 RepID=A0ABU8E2X5_9ACTN